MLLLNTYDSVATMQLYPRFAPLGVLEAYSISILLSFSSARMAFTFSLSSALRILMPRTTTA